MVPDLGDEQRFFNVLSIVGTPGATVFDNDYLIKTQPRDTAYLLSTTAKQGADEFRSYSIQNECLFNEAGSHVEFGNALQISGQYPRFRVLRKFSDGTEIELHLEATSAVSYFAHIPGLYLHWSLLCRYHGEIRPAKTGIGLAAENSEVRAIRGLCTFEYAKGVGVYSLASQPVPPSKKIPIQFFTYQIINLDEETQLLFTRLLGPRDFVIQQALYVRKVDGTSVVHTKAVRMDVVEYLEHSHTTPDGHVMALPQRLTWQVKDASGNRLLELDCTVDTPYTYGLGAGFVTSYQFSGSFKERSVRGRGYMEYIDRRAHSENG
ncbi:Hypothetical protein HDN1F_12350 [gamma proteobacterium HdN1]|nr:Hypothetical protein HDN1F_12350 [gamma proteobacterium HdN1]